MTKYVPLMYCCLYFEWSDVFLHNFWRTVFLKFHVWCLENLNFLGIRYENISKKNMIPRPLSKILRSTVLCNKIITKILKKAFSKFYIWGDPHLKRPCYKSKHIVIFWKIFNVKLISITCYYHFKNKGKRLRNFIKIVAIGPSVFRY